MFVDFKWDTVDLLGLETVVRRFMNESYIKKRLNIKYETVVWSWLTES